MSLKVAFQMDHVSGIDIAGDTTFALMLEAQARGHKLFHYTPERLSMRNGKVEAGIEAVKVADVKGAHAELGDPVHTDLSTMDVIMLRQDPPFDMAYITTTHLLERLHPATLVVNDPEHVRNAPEKLFVTEYGDLMPETLITRDPEVIRSFRDEYGDIIVKPLYGNGGAAVFRVREDDENLSALLELFAINFREPYVVQRYLPAVREGDRRIIIVDGEPAGGINRVPMPGDARSNMHVGGRADPYKLNDRDREICARIGPEVKARGFILVGIDVIGDVMTEINVTSPTGIRELSRFDDINVAGMVWDAIESRRG
jgi:glutathione synthase